MKITECFRRYLILPMLALLLCLLYGVNTNAATKTGKVYFTVEKFTIGQGYVVEPCEVTITEGEKVSSITARVLKAKGYEYILKNGMWYLEGIKKADSGNTKVPVCIQNEWGSSISSETDSDLCEFDYNSQSGWMYYCNNSSPMYLPDECEAHDGDVIRWRFTLFYGDLGSDRISLPNMDTLIKSMAVYNANKSICVEKGFQSAYKAAYDFAVNMDDHYIDENVSGHSQKEIQAKIQSLCSKLPTQTTIDRWNAEKAAAAKEAAAKAAAAKLAKKYTPVAPQWKSLKSKKTRTATLTWKKNSKATGYEIYMSTKKSSGYKKIATVKSWKKITYTKKKLTKKKTYYFKLRAYKKAGGKVYRSSFSKVKKVKVK